MNFHVMFFTFIVKMETNNYLALDDRERILRGLKVILF